MHRHTNMHVKTQAHILEYAYTSKQTHAHMYTYIHIHIHICICMHTHMHIYIYICTCLCLLTQEHICTQCIHLNNSCDFRLFFSISHFLSDSKYPWFSEIFQNIVKNCHCNSVSWFTVFFSSMMALTLYEVLTTWMGVIFKRDY